MATIPHAPKSNEQVEDKERSNGAEFVRRD
jgi:hypothetical protein